MGVDEFDGGATPPHGNARLLADMLQKRGANKRPAHTEISQYARRKWNLAILQQMTSDIDIFAQRGQYGNSPSIADYIDADGDCWLWTGSTSGADGYGSVQVNRMRWSVHRLMWEMLVGPIPEGLQIDHLCKNPSCCNPDHLEPVTQAENIRRSGVGANHRNKTHCPQGHSYSGSNLRTDKSGYRICRTCRRGSAVGLSNKQKTHCPQGHAYSEENTVVRSRGAGMYGQERYSRRCRVCLNKQIADSRKRKREEATATVTVSHTDKERSSSKP